MQPSEIGERTEAAVLGALACAGKQVLVPFGGGHRYDLAYEENGRLMRVQCKSGREVRGVILFPTHWSGRGPRPDYRDEADVFGVYCHSRGEVYLVPVDHVPVRGATLRLEPTRNRQRAGVRWASDYLLARHIQGGGGSKTSTDVGAQLRLAEA